MSPEDEAPTSPRIESDLNGMNEKNLRNGVHSPSPQNGVDKSKWDNSGRTINGAAANGYKNGTTENMNGDAKKDLTFVWTPLLEIPLQDEGVIYGPSNNNEWKESEEINNLRNSMHKAHGNNNGSLMNGKNGIGAEKIEEQDPLTGACKLSQPPDDDGPSCGILGFRPKWARNFASTHIFMVVFLLAWILQGMYLTYFVSVITTIEKLFQIKSKTTGMLMSASEIGQICTAMLLTYFAGRGHRPRWIAVGMVVFAIASFGCSLPHFIFGEQLMHSNAFFAGGQPSSKHLVALTKANSSLVSNGLEDLNLCFLKDNLTGYGNEAECEDAIKEEQASHSKITVIVLCIFFVSLLSAGVGQTAVSTLGIPYIDDNVASRESPIYLAITIGVRILGPATGFIVGSFCTRIYVDLSDPGIEPTDPRWISAWWLGPVMIGTLMMLASIAMFTFPKQLRGNRIPPPSKIRTIEGQTKVQPIKEAKPKLRDFPKTVRRQLSNDILMFRTASSVFHLLPIAGLYTFLPKYLETQFRLPAADAALITAFGGILVMGIGIVISGIVILKTNPTARWVAGWIAFTALIYSCGMAVLMFIGCNMDDFAGLSRYNTNEIAKFEPTCNVTCSCDFNKFSPICGTDGMTYFSSCHAGCKKSELIDSKRVFSDCDCIPDITEIGKPYEAVSGYCDGNCQSFVLFICVFAFCVFMHSTSEVGSMLLIMRCTDPKDKAMAMGVIQSAIGLFGNVPCPIIYGAVVDSACLVWKTVCGKPGACSLYDIDVFRHYFLGITAGIMLIAFVMDLIVWQKSHRIDIAPSDAAAPATTETEYEKPTVVPESCV